VVLAVEGPAHAEASQPALGKERLVRVGLGDEMGLVGRIRPAIARSSAPP
jgi:hypothetical protein